MWKIMIRSPMYYFFYGFRWNAFSIFFVFNKIYWLILQKLKNNMMKMFEFYWWWKFLFLLFSVYNWRDTSESNLPVNYNYCAHLLLISLYAYVGYRSFLDEYVQCEGTSGEMLNLYEWMSDLGRSFFAYFIETDDSFCFFVYSINFFTM